MPTTDVLYEATLPLGDDLERWRVLVHLVSRADQTMRIVVSDLDVMEPAYSSSGAEFPDHYEVREVCEMEPYLRASALQVEALMLAGAAPLGQLTLARAVHAMATKEQGVDQALATAIDESRRCEAMVQRHQRIIDSFTR